jgi:hypothetical protein
MAIKDIKATKNLTGVIETDYGDYKKYSRTTTLVIFLHNFLVLDCEILYFYRTYVVLRVTKFSKLKAALCN